MSLVDAGEAMTQAYHEKWARVVASLRDRLPDCRRDQLR